MTLITIEDASDVARSAVSDAQFGYSVDDLTVEIPGFMREREALGEISRGRPAEQATDSKTLTLVKTKQGTYKTAWEQNICWMDDALEFWRIT